MLMNYTNSNDSKMNCKNATFPQLFQGKVKFDELEGDELKNIATIATGSAAYYGGVVENKGCAEVELTIKYIGGDDCDSCTKNETLTTKDYTIKLPAGSIMSIPDGWWQQIDAVVIGNSGEPLALSEGSSQLLSLTSMHTPECQDCLVTAV